MNFPESAGSYQSKIVVVGSANIDLIARTPRLPKPGETVTGNRFMTVPGGKGANQAVAASRLGAKVYFVGRVGNDMFGASLVESLSGSGVVLDHLGRDEESPTGTALIGVSSESGENSIIVVPGANGKVTPEEVTAASATILDADAVVLSLEIPMESIKAALEIAASEGVLTVLNPAPAMPLSDEIIKLCDVLTPNEHEVAILAGDETLNPSDAAKILIGRGAKLVVVTLGSSGAVAFDDLGGVWPVPAYVATEVVDTTAAGDCYTAGLAVALSEGARPTDAMNFAAAAASISVTRTGAQTSLPTRSEVEQLINSTKRQ